MADERGMDPELWEHEDAPCLDDLMQPTFLAAMRRSEADAAALARLAGSLPERFR